MKTINVKVPGHLLVPFGVEKWRIEDVRVAGVSTDATYFKSAAPLCHIDTSRADALRLNDIDRVLPIEKWPDASLPHDQLRTIHALLEDGCQMDATSESKFLSLYFEYLIDCIVPKHDWQRERLPGSEPRWGFEALLPLPQAHLYVRDPLGANTHSFSSRRSECSRSTSPSGRGGVLSSSKSMARATSGRRTTS